MTKLPNTSQTAIAITFLVMNLSTALRRFFCAFVCALAKNTRVLRLLMTKSYRSPLESQNTLILSEA
jgi:hypothetical protein